MASFLQVFLPNPVRTSPTPICATCPAYLILFDSSSRTVFLKDCRSWSSSLQTEIPNWISATSFGTFGGLPCSEGHPGRQTSWGPILGYSHPPFFKSCDIILKLTITHSFEIMKFRRMKLSKSDISAEQLLAGFLLQPCQRCHEFKYFRPAYYQTHLISLSRLHKFYIWVSVVKDIKNKTTSFSLDCVV